MLWYGFQIFPPSFHPPFLLHKLSAPTGLVFSLSSIYLAYCQLLVLANAVEFLPNMAIPWEGHFHSPPAKPPHSPGTSPSSPLPPSIQCCALLLNNLILPPYLEGQAWGMTMTTLDLVVPSPVSSTKVHTQ